MSHPGRPHEGSRRWSLKIAAVASLIGLTALLSGCLLTRVYTFKHQFCDFRHNFRLVVDDDARLVMFHPVLLDSDVVWLIGAEPTERLRHGRQLEMVYLVEKDLPQPDANFDLPLLLRFQRVGGDDKLHEAVLDKNLRTMLSPALITRTVEHVCVSHPSVVAKSVEIDLSELDRSSLPNRNQIREALGSPHRIQDRGRVLNYEYRLKNAGPEVEKSRAQLWFDPSGQTLQRVRLNYLRYELDADFVEHRAVIRIRL